MSDDVVFPPIQPTTVPFPPLHFVLACVVGTPGVQADSGNSHKCIGVEVRNSKWSDAGVSSGGFLYVGDGVNSGDELAPGEKQFYNVQDLNQLFFRCITAGGTTAFARITVLRAAKTAS